MRYEWYDSGKYWADLRNDRSSLVALIATRRIGVNGELLIPMAVDPRSGRRTVLSHMLPSDHLSIVSQLYALYWKIPHIFVANPFQVTWMYLKDLLKVVVSIGQ